MHVYIFLHKIMWSIYHTNTRTWNKVLILGIMKRDQNNDKTNIGYTLMETWRDSHIEARLYSFNWTNESCSSIEQSTWQDVLQEEGIKIIPRQRCSVGEGDDLLMLRYSTVSCRIMFPCLSMQWKLPRKNLPSLIPTSIWRNKSFLTRAIGSKSDPSEADSTIVVLVLLSASCSIPTTALILVYVLHQNKLKHQ